MLNERLSGAWRVWTLDTPEDVAAAQFVRRYGVQPQYIVEKCKMLWLGPIPETRCQ